MPDELLRVVYVSRHALAKGGEPMNEEIERILDAARRSNRRCGITGALLYNHGLFAQVLEGPQAAIEDTFERIQCDERHQDILLLDCQPITRRRFSEWSMAFVAGNETLPSAFRPRHHATEAGRHALDGDEVQDTLLRLLKQADDRRDVA